MESEFALPVGRRKYTAKSAKLGARRVNGDVVPRGLLPMAEVFVRVGDHLAPNQRRTYFPLRFLIDSGSFISILPKPSLTKKSLERGEPGLPAAWKPSMRSGYRITLRTANSKFETPLKEVRFIFKEYPHREFRGRFGFFGRVRVSKKDQEDEYYQESRGRICLKGEKPRRMEDVAPKVVYPGSDFGVLALVDILDHFKLKFETLDDVLSVDDKYCMRFEYQQGGDPVDLESINLYSSMCQYMWEGYKRFRQKEGLDSEITGSMDGGM